MATIAENLLTLVTNKANIKQAIEYKLDNEITGNMSLWPALIRSIDPDTNTYGPHCDENGIWHKPAEWPDIESLPIPENSGIIYLLYDNHLTSNAYASFTANRSSGSITIDKGHIEDGEYVVDQQLYSGSSNQYILESLYESVEDYTIYRIQGVYLASVVTSAYGSTSNLPYYPAVTQSCVMRYGSMPWGTNCKFLCAYLESDNVLNFMANRTNHNISLADAYYNNYNMLRWRNTGWNIKNNSINSFFRFFQSCIYLSDISTNFSGWAKSITASNGLQLMFYDCLRIKYIDITDWDTSAMTGSLASMFYRCTNLKKIKGIEDLDLSNCTTIASMFQQCYSLSGDFDFEGWGISDKCTSVNSFMNNCSSVKSVSIKGWDLTNITTCGSMFSNCSNLENVNITNIIPITSTCTNSSNIFYLCTKLKSIVFDGWDFSGCTTNASIYYLIYGCCSITSVIYRNCTFPSSLSSQSNAYCIVGNNMLNLLYFDMSGFDSRVFTGTQMATTLSGLSMCEDLYPPTHINKQLNISSNYALTHDSLLRILNNLDTVTGTVKLILGVYHNANLTAAEKAIATNKGWTVTAS